jgi:hypothetical protein
MFKPSAYQSAIFDWIENGRGDGIVIAVAGSGKTTTLVQAAHRIKVSSVFLAFNKHIAEELGKRLSGTGMVAKTFHSIGNGLVTKHLGRIRIDDKKYRKLVRTHFDGVVLPKDVRQDIISTASKLVDLARVTMTDIRDKQALRDLCNHHSLTPFPEAIDAVYPVVVKGISHAQTHREIDFTDMIYLPLIWGLQPAKMQFVLVDECQDLNAMQLRLALSMRADGGRMLFVGDEKQAIYGFAGADAESFRRIKQVTGATELPLSICYRCPSSHLDLARAIVPQIEARPDAPVGEIIYEPKDDRLHEIVQEGDLILCRLTAPLVTWCIKLIQNRVAARVRGRDIGRDLLGILDKIYESRLGRFEYEDLPAYLKSYETEQINYLVQRDADESQIQSVADRVECLQVCFRSFDAAKSLPALMDAIEGLFSDERSAVWMSTIHKAKGLENKRVLILKPDKLPLVWEDQQPWQFEQEMNLKYVALTRATETLIIMGKAPTPPTGGTTVPAPAPVEVQKPLFSEGFYTGDLPDHLRPVEALYEAIPENVSIEQIDDIFDEAEREAALRDEFPDYDWGSTPAPVLIVKPEPDYLELAYSVPYPVAQPDPVEPPPAPVEASRFEPDFYRWLTAALDPAALADLVEAAKTDHAFMPELRPQFDRLLEAAGAPVKTPSFADRLFTH